MTKRRNRFGIAALAVLIIIVVALALIHPRYPLPYIVKVAIDQDPEYADIHDFPASVIAASAVPVELPIAPDERVTRALEAHPDITSLDAFLEESETTALLVVHGGTLVAEHYRRGHDRESVQNTFSVSKSVTSALVGLAVRDGLLAYGAPITTYLPELAERDERFGAITVEHLLGMRSGIRFSDDVTFPFVTCDNPMIYYFPDLESVVLERTTIAKAPGEFLYNNYNPPLLGLILKRTSGLTVSAYLEREIWSPLGATRPAGWSVDERGFERMESGFHATARDLARFGLMYLRRGAVEGRAVIPRDWVAATTESRENLELEKYNGRTWDYRGGWWIVPREEGPSDFCGIGHFGQFIYVSPQFDAVFVRNGPGRGEWGDFDWTALFFFVAERLAGDAAAE